MELARLRTLIDDRDRKLLRLLDDRLQLAVRIGRLKTTVEDPAREQEVIRNVRARGSGLLDPAFLESVFLTIIAQSRELQARRLRLAGFQGERGAYGELAVRAHDEALVPTPCREFRDVFLAVERGDLDVGLVPVENSIEGSVGEVNDLLVETDLSIVAEVLLPIHHCLLAPPRTDYRELKVVYSHPQALGQCRGFIARHRLEPRPFYDTAGAARWLAHEAVRSSAVIASALAADLYGLEIVQEHIEDHQANTTRFVVLAREPSPAGGRKGSIVFSAAHRAGALLEVLKVFADEGINLTRIESRPVRRDPGAFAFLLDFLGSEDEPRVRDALARLPDLTLASTVLGFYEPAAGPSDGAAPEPDGRIEGVATSELRRPIQVLEPQADLGVRRHPPVAAG